MALENLTPVTRKESILNGEDITPVTREEYFWKQAASGSGEGTYIVNASGDASGLTCDKTASEILEHVTDAKIVFESPDPTQSGFYFVVPITIYSHSESVGYLFYAPLVNPNGTYVLQFAAATGSEYPVYTPPEG